MAAPYGSVCDKGLTGNSQCCVFCFRCLLDGVLQTGLGVGWAVGALGDSLYQSWLGLSSPVWNLSVFSAALSKTSGRTRELSYNSSAYTKYLRLWGVLPIDLCVKSHHQAG